ncbi:helix-turn-helix domain-containing protein [Bradyrhizobium sp. Tv2a-2]|uniref:helix-turn-helix domain-containing protein n=1 Tax=Bradyrhizobium sp. Tv2a-2 TaxID=113395 RepID=UPI0004150C8C|nr:helix-turn-helix domain-containing protein [Bradyrhizobium sp. Tv2a-2]
MKAFLAAIGSNGQSCADCLVRPFSICASLDKTEMQEFERLSRHAHFAPCETVFAEEEMAISFYNLIEGVMRLYKLLPDGRRQIVGFALPGDFLGMTASGRNAFSADAINAVAVCRFSKVSFQRFAEDKPHLLRRINEFAIRELSQAREHMVLLGRRSAEEKVATFLVSWRDRLARQNGASATLPLPMSRQDIADYLGLTIETVSRTFTKLERVGVIEIISGGVRLLDPARAEALAAA